MPKGLNEKLVESELVTYKGALDWDIDAFLYKPKDMDENKKYPAIVWVHGGPMRQMRGAWHPSSTYSHFYAYNQYLVSQGYVVISPNFRGGIGYGSEFRYGLYKKKGIDDTIDIVSAGNYLKSLDYVDEEKVAVYGLSYGGYMTLHSLTQYPESFAMGINIAGLWDIAQWGRWIRDTYGNYVGDANFCGMVEERPDLWAKGSPVFYKENLNKPLMNLQGTKDPNVDFNQLNRIVKDCVKLGVEHESVYYPDEMHTFRFRRTWKDALPRMNAFFDKYLKD
jgi:dipeptidyl aminopeptidase/acylaminoacyl peptidase